MTKRATWVHLVGLAAVVLMFLLSSPAVAQTGAIAGKVTGEDGKPLKDAQIIIERVDIKGTYKVKTKGKGDYFHAGLPLGTYNVSVEVGGKNMETVRGVRTTLGDPREVNFNLQELRAKQQATQQAIESGNLTQEQMRGLTAEQREALDKQMKDRAESMKKNKALNEAFNAGMTAFQAKQFDAAIESFAKASELDPKQQAVWSSLAEAYNGLGKTKTGAEQEAAFNKAIEAYNKAIELNPTEGGYYNNLGLVLVGLKKFEEAQASLEKAAQLEPAKAGMYFYNLGAVLVNTGQLEPAGIAFKRAIEADPKHANAQYQYGIYLISKATTTADGKVIPPPGTREAFQAYLDLDPTGMFAESAKGMIATIESSLQTEYTNPDAKKKGKKK
jgi:tetratricopeptide (TPR) repeat protein